jgi:hypothetical protein
MGLETWTRRQLRVPVWVAVAAILTVQIQQGAVADAPVSAEKTLSSPFVKIASDD